MWNQTIHIGRKDALVLQEVPAGEYDLRVSWFYGRFKDAGMSFRVDPGIITYIGDFQGTIDNDDSIGMLGIHRTIEVLDNQQSTEQAFKSRYPRTAATYPVHYQAKRIVPRN